MALELVHEDRLTTLYLGDALEAVRTLNYDLVVTSPPYNLGGSSGRWHNQRSTKPLTMVDGYHDFADNKPWPQYYAEQGEILLTAWNRLPEDGAIFYNHKPRIQKGVLYHPIRWVPEALTLRQEIVWDRGGFGINYSDSFYLPTHEVLLLFAKPGFKLESHGAAGNGTVWRFARNKKMEHDHPAVWPIELPRRVLRTCASTVHRDGVVLDPYVGSGTTLLAARRMGVRSIGVEISPRSVEVALDRLRRRRIPRTSPVGAA